MTSWIHSEIIWPLRLLDLKFEFPRYWKYCNTSTFFPTYQLYVVLSCKLYHHARPQNVTRYQEMNLSDLLILLSIIEFSSHIFAKLQLCIGYRITSTHSCAEDFKLEPVSFCSRIYTVCKVLKFIYSERARKVETIFLLNLTLFFLAFSEILNFTCHII